MRCNYLFICNVAIILSVTGHDDKGSLLSRRKRYAVFPEGSTWSIAICSMTQAIVPNNQGIWTEAINWGISYDLPNETRTFEYFLFPFRAVAANQRRSRRDLYSKMEKLLDSVGYDGRSCVYRTLCEASKKFPLTGGSLFEEVLRIIFHYPLARMLPSEPEDHRLYHSAFKTGKEKPNIDCSELYPHCPMSLIDVALSGFSNIV